MKCSPPKDEKSVDYLFSDLEVGMRSGSHGVLKDFKNLIQHDQAVARVLRSTSSKFWLQCISFRPRLILMKQRTRHATQIMFTTHFISYIMSNERQNRNQTVLTHIQKEYVNWETPLPFIRSHNLVVILALSVIICRTNILPKFTNI